MTDRPPVLLFVCSANRCRSPLAAASARRHLADRGLEATVHSAGLAAGGAGAGQPATRAIRRAAAGLGLDLDDHRSRPVDAELVAEADVIAAMEIEHVLELSSRHPERRHAILTLPELAATAGRRPEDGGAAGHGPGLDGPALRRRVEATDRAPMDELLSGRLDVPDPTGGSGRDHDRTAERIDDLVDQVLTAWFGPLPVRRPPPSPSASRWRRRGRRG